METSHPVLAELHSTCRPGLTAGGCRLHGTGAAPTLPCISIPITLHLPWPWPWPLGGAAAGAGVDSAAVQVTKALSFLKNPFAFSLSVLSEHSSAAPCARVPLAGGCSSAELSSSLLMVPTSTPCISLCCAAASVPLPFAHCAQHPLISPFCSRSPFAPGWAGVGAAVGCFFLTFFFVRLVFYLAPYCLLSCPA